MKRIKKALVLVLALLMFVAPAIASANTTYPGDGDYQVKVYYDSTMQGQPMKGHADEAFVKAILTKKENGKYDITFLTKRMKYMGASGQVVKMTVDDKTVASEENRFAFTDVTINPDSTSTPFGVNARCKMKILEVFHRDVDCFLKLNKI